MLKLLALLFFVNVNACEENLEKVGAGVLSYIFWDIYQVNYFKNSNKDTTVIELVYLRDVEKKHSVSGWKKSIGHLENIDIQLEWLINNTTDIKKGDRLAICRVGDDKVMLRKNGTVYAEKNDIRLNKIVHEPWIGKDPINDSLKWKLLGRGG